MDHIDYSCFCKHLIGCNERDRRCIFPKWFKHFSAYVFITRLTAGDLNINQKRFSHIRNLICHDSRRFQIGLILKKNIVNIKKAYFWLVETLGSEMQFYDIKEVQCRYTTFWFIMILIAWHDKHHASASSVSHRCVCRRRLWTVLNQVSLRTVFSAP